VVGGLPPSNRVEGQQFNILNKEKDFGWFLLKKMFSTQQNFNH
jgi:hypothetical protein